MPEGAEHLKQAPEPLDLVRRFVNTQNRMRGYDLIASIEETARWLSEAGYACEEAISEKEFERLHTLREALRAVLAVHTFGSTSGSGREVDNAALDLNELCATVALRPAFDQAGRPGLSADSDGAERLIEDVLAASIWAQYTEVWERLKVCANENCQWAFYDRSKNRSGNWCVMEICGSRAKMRAYRKRQGAKP